MVAMTQKDFYAVLGVERDASADQIKKTFRAKAAKLHPDNLETGDEAAFKELVAAYEVLSSEDKRAAYDRYGHDAFTRSGGASYQDFDMSAFSNLGDIFEYFFGGGMPGAGGRSRGVSRGSDLRYDLELTLAEAAFGCEKKISFKHLRVCQTCNGQKGAPGSEKKTCSTCQGQGQIRQVTSTLFGQFAQVMPCPKCQGEGQTIDKPCPDCSGSGFDKVSRNIDIKIPAGVDTGSRIRINGEGDAGRGGGPPGDVYVICHVKEHGSLLRDGMTIHLEQHISFSMAALGGELLVETLNGPKRLKIPAGVQSGSQLVVKGEGIPRLGHPQHKGDQVVHIFVETPTKLSGEEKELFSKLAELRGDKLTVEDDENNGGEQHKDNHNSLFDVIAGVFKPKGSPEDSPGKAEN